MSKEYGQWICVDFEVPSDDRYILMYFANFTTPLVGRYEGDEENGGAFYYGDEDEPISKNELIVDYWMELPPDPEV